MFCILSISVVVEYNIIGCWGFTPCEMQVRGGPTYTAHTLMENRISRTLCVHDSGVGPVAEDGGMDTLPTEAAG